MNETDEFMNETNRIKRIRILEAMVAALEKIPFEKEKVKQAYAQYESVKATGDYTPAALSRRFDKIGEADKHFIEEGNKVYAQLEVNYSRYEEAATTADILSHSDFANMLTTFTTIIQQPGYTVLDYQSFIRAYTNSYVYLNIINDTICNTFSATAEARKLLEIIPKYKAWKLRSAVNELRSVVNSVKMVFGLDVIDGNYSYKAADSFMSSLYIANVTRAIERINVLIEEEKN